MDKAIFFKLFFLAFLFDLLAVSLLSILCLSRAHFGHNFDFLVDSAPLIQFLKRCILIWVFTVVIVFDFGILVLLGLLAWVLLVCDFLLASALISQALLLDKVLVYNHYRSLLLLTIFSPLGHFWVRIDDTSHDEVHRK